MRETNDRDDGTKDTSDRPADDTVDSSSTDLQHLDPAAAAWTDRERSATDPQSADGDGPYDPEPGQQEAAELPTADLSPAGIPAIEDDPDVPVNPDEQTVAETQAAYEAVHYSALSGQKKYRGPRSIAILVLVILGILGLGVYAVIWSDHLRQKNEKIELRVLEERHVMSTVQQRNQDIRQRQYELSYPGQKLAPANNVYRPLDAQEKALFDRRLAEYGTQFEPNENQKALIEETKKLIAASTPATQAVAPGK